MSILPIRKVIGTAIFLFISYQVQSQQGLAPSNFSGYFEANGQYYQADSAIDALKVEGINVVDPKLAKFMMV